MSSERITPRTLKGFRDFLPEAMIPREQLIDTARAVYRSFGFSPIDTPVLELLEILQGKGGEESDRLMYSFTRSSLGNGVIILSVNVFLAYQPPYLTSSTNIRPRRRRRRLR